MLLQFVLIPKYAANISSNPLSHSQQHRIVAGKVLGGSGSIDDMMYIRGSRHLYDDWAKKGCEGWSYEDVLPYFIKAEQYTSLVESGETNSYFQL